MPVVHDSSAAVVHLLAALDTTTGAGDALERLAERLDRAEEAEKRLHRTLASDLFATSIANGAFGLLLLNPPYDGAPRNAA